MHPRAVGIEDARDPGLDVMLGERGGERLAAPLAFVVAGPLADRVDVAPVLLGLRMDLGLAVDLAGRGDQHLRAGRLRELEHVHRAEHRRLQRTNRVPLVVRRRGRTREVIDLVDLGVVAIDDVVPHELEPARVSAGLQRGDVLRTAGIEVVETDHMIAVLDEPRAQM